MNKWSLFKLILSAAVIWLLIPSPSPAEYPQIDISGYKKWEYKKAEVDPSRNYFNGLSLLSYVPNYSGGPEQERLQLRILGQLSEDLSVSYDLEQQPETPERYDVKVKYKDNELTFGDFNANFSGNEFATTSKYLNGVMLTAKNSWYDITAVPSSKLKSQTQSLTTQQGNNTRGPYNLGHGSIVEGSESVELNGIRLTRNTDYTIDYFEGKITFNRILTSVDQFKYTFEYTNIIDLFFPTLSKPDFLGFQSRFTIDPETFGKPLPKEAPVTSNARETFPSTGSLEPEVAEGESYGEYQLKNTPLVMFSEKLTFMGNELKKNEDYSIRYTDGMIKLLTRFMPGSQEALVIEYKYYQTSAESVSLPGIGSFGPYQLSHAKIVPDSERIEVDGKLFVRNLDYSINYEKGQVTFNITVGPTSQIKARYRYNLMAPPVISPSIFPKQINMGMTYLRVSSKAGQTGNTTTGIEAATGQTIINNKYHIYLQNRPVVPSSEATYSISVKIDGRLLTPEVDYSFPATYLDPTTGYYRSTPEAALGYINDRYDPSNGYQTGTIKFLDPNLISATSEITVTYNYYKVIVGRYSGSGDGTRGPFFLRNVRNLAPGTETVQVWDQGSSITTNYIRNSSFESNAGDTGYSINYQADNPYVLFNKPLLSTKNFQIVYQYVPPSGFSSKDLSQSVLGFDGSFKIGELFKVDTAYAQSDVDRFIVRTPNTKITPGNGGKNYSLSSPADIIEGSEKVYVNDRLLNRDLDYFISYTVPGSLTFYYITPTTLDAIRADYDYQSTSGAQAEVKPKTGYAYRIGAQGKLFNDTLNISGVTKKIDYDFTPLGGTVIGLGAAYREYNLNYIPNFNALSASYSYKENDNPIGSYRDSFLRSYDNAAAFSVTPKGLLKIDLGYRNFRTLDDPLPGSQAHNSETSQESYSMSLTPADWKKGILTLTQKYDLSQTRTVNDYFRDSSAYSDTKFYFGHANGSLAFADRLSFGYDYQASEPLTVALKSSSAEGTSEAVISHSRSVDTAYTATANLNFIKFIQSWTARYSSLNHEESTLARNFLSTQETVVTHNETFHTDLAPSSLLSSSLDHNRQESTTLVVGGTNPKNEKTSADLKLTPASWISTGWSGTQSESIPDSGLINRTSGKSNAYAFNYTPFSFDRFKLTSAFTLSDNTQTGPSGVTVEVATQTNSFSQNYTVNLVPISIAPLSFGFALENYRNKNDHPIAANQIDLETVNQIVNLGLTLTPTTPLVINGSFTEKITKVVHDLNPSLSGQQKKKTNLDAKLSYQVFSWGALIYERNYERNGGEIQSGTLVPLNLEKTTQTYGINITIPLNNLVVNNFVFLASLKTVDFANLDNAQDNFKATLLSFEGTLNF